MNTTRPFLLIALLMLALPASAASLSAQPTDASANASFNVPVYFDAEGEHVNAIEGSIHVPEGIEVENITSAGSALTLFVHEPSYSLSDRTISFMGGAPKGIADNSRVLLFTIRARAQTPGTYTLKPTGFLAYRSDGEGTALSISTQPIDVLVDKVGSGRAAAFPSGRPTPIIAEIGSDTSLFDGNYFAIISGGDVGSGVDHYIVREGLFGTSVRSDRFYVLSDQAREHSLQITAVNRDGRTITTFVFAPNPWKEIGMLAGAVLVFGVVALLLIRRLGRRP